MKFLKNAKTKIVAASTVVVAGSASAADHSAAIDAAVTSATSNVGLVATGLITVAAVMFGVYMVTRALSK